MSIGFSTHKSNKSEINNVSVNYTGKSIIGITLRCA